MKTELLEFHTRELKIRREHLRGWQEAPDDDQKCKSEHIATMEGLVAFHESAVKFLSEI